MPLLKPAAPPAVNAAKKKGLDVGAELDHLRSAAAAAAGGDALSAPAVVDTLDKLSQKVPPAAVREQFENALRQLREDLHSLPDALPSLSASDSKKYLSGIDPRAQPDDKMCGTEIPINEPLRVNVIGSFLLGLWTPVRGVDIAVSAPPSYFGDRDVPNYRYHAKRAALLGRLARHLNKKCSNRWSVGLSGTHCGISYSPVLEVRPKTTTSPVFLRVLIAADAEALPSRLLSPTRRNVRARGDSAIVDNAALATPAYNASILADTCLLTHLRTLHAASSSAPNFAAATRLLLAWCSRRRLLTGSFVPAVLIASVLAARRAPRSATAAHLLRVALTRVAAGALRTLELDSVPVCATLDSALLRRAQQEACAALALLDAPVATLDPWRGALPALFVTARGAAARPAPTASLFDAFVRVEATAPTGQRQIVDGRFGETLRSALVTTGRAACVERINDKLYGIEMQKFADTRRKVDLCPVDVEPDEFKAFWGDRVQLRRFGDGTIKHAVVWSGEPHTMDTIVKYAVERHLDASINAEVVLAQLETAAGMQSDDESSVLRMYAALEELGKTMRALEGLPLRVIRVAGVSPQLRRAAVQRAKSKRVVDPIETIAFFESSNSWPKDPVAISASKAAFYVALRDALAGKGLITQATISCLDVSLGGFAFRLRIVVDGEEKTLDDPSQLVWQSDGRDAVHTLLRNAARTQPALGAVARVSKRWLAAHLLFGQLGDRAHELVELLVLRALEGPNARVAKSTFAGFVRFLHLLAEYPWETAPVIISTPPDDDDDDEDKVESELLTDTRQEAQYSSAFLEFERKGRPPLAITVDMARPYDWFNRTHLPPAPIAQRVIATARAALVLFDDVLSGNKPSSALNTLLFRTPIRDVYHIALDLRPHLSKPGMQPAERLRESLTAELGDEAWFMRDVFGKGNVIYVGWRPRAFKKRPFSVKGMQFAAPEGAALVPDRNLMLQEIRRLGHGLIKDVRFLQKDEAFPESA